MPSLYPKTILIGLLLLLSVFLIPSAKAQIDDLGTGLEIGAEPQALMVNFYDPIILEYNQVGIEYGKVAEKIGLEYWTMACEICSVSCLDAEGYTCNNEYKPVSNACYICAQFPAIRHFF